MDSVNELGSELTLETGQWCRDTIPHTLETGGPLLTQVTVTVPIHVQTIPHTLETGGPLVTRVTVMMPQVVRTNPHTLETGGPLLSWITARSLPGWCPLATSCEVHEQPTKAR